MGRRRAARRRSEAEPSGWERIVQRVERFKCYRCPYCCFFATEEECPLVFSWEARRLSELLEEIGASNYEFKPFEVYMDAEGRCVVLLYRWVIRGFCPFFDLQTRSCRIHPEKPYSCRLYPLLVAVPNGEVRISGACEWVERNKWIIEHGELLEKVFPAEVEAARQVLIEYNAAREVLEENGFRRAEDLSKCRVFMGFEELVTGDKHGEA